MNPTVDYILGGFALGLWHGTCMTVLLLAANRLLELWKGHWAKYGVSPDSTFLFRSLFAGNKTTFALLLPLSYHLYIWFFTTPVVFNSAFTTFLLDPIIHRPNTSFEVSPSNFSL